MEGEKGNPLVRKSLSAMRRIMKAGERSRGIWYILCDTSSTVLGRVPGNEPLPPSSCFTLEYEPLPPWTYFGFDHMLRRELKNGIPTPLEACMFKHLKMYGRSVSALLFICYSLNFIIRILTNYRYGFELSSVLVYNRRRRPCVCCNTEAFMWGRFKPQERRTSFGSVFEPDACRARCR